MESDILASFQLRLVQWAEAIVANEATRIGSFAKPDWTIVTPEGAPGNRAGFLAAVESGNLAHSEISLEILEASIYGDVAVVVVAHGTNRGRWQGERFAIDEWVTETFVRRASGWLCVFSALTPNHAAVAATSGRD